MNNMPARLSLFRRFRATFSTSSLFVLAASVTPAVNTASCPPDQTLTEVGCLPKDPILFISSFYGIGLGLIGGVALIFIIIGGYTILTSRGNPSQLNVGKSYIFYSLAGLLLAIFGYFFIELFLVDILHIPGFSH